MATRSKSTRKYGSAADRAKAGAAVAGPQGGSGTMFKNLGDGTEFFNVDIPKGKTEVKYTLRLLPYIVSDPKHPDGQNIAPEGELWYKRPFKRVRQVGVDKKSYISPLSIGKACPINEYYIKAKADPSIPDTEANKFKAQDCVMYNVQVIEKGEPGPIMFWWFSYACFEKRLKKELLDPDNDQYATFMDLVGGYDLRVRFQKEQFAGNDYSNADSISFVERDDIDESILDEVINLDDVLVIKSYDELNNIFLEVDSGEEAEEEPEEKPAKQTRQRKTAKPEPEPEEDEGTGDDVPLNVGEEEEDNEPECPHDLTFAVDFNSKKICRKCEIKDDCEEAFDALPEDGDEKEKDPEPEPTQTRNKKTTKPKGDCPHGFVFAVDCDKHKQCDVCKVWDSCMEAQEKL